MDDLKALSAMIKGSGNPDMVVSLLAQKNPQFAQFVRANQGKSAHQIASENGIDWGIIQSLMR